MKKEEWVGEGGRMNEEQKGGMTEGRMPCKKGERGSVAESGRI
jgi:hypothetical protein